MENKIDIIIIPFHNQLEFNNIQDVLLENGCTYIHNTKDKINYHSVYECFLLKVKSKVISIGLDHPDTVVKYKYILSHIYNLLDVDDIDKLSKFFKNTVRTINYNEPRKLVYENKILKFNQYKNV